MTADTTMEGALARAEADVEAATRSAHVLAGELRRARSAAAAGQVRELRRALQAAVELADELQRTVREARGSYDVDEGGLLGSGAYAKELLATAAEAGVAMFEEDDRLLCYPSIVRVLPGGSGPGDRPPTGARGMRPSVVDPSSSSRAQNAGPRFKPEPFLASLARRLPAGAGPAGQGGGRGGAAAGCLWGADAASGSGTGVHQSRSSPVTCTCSTRTGVTVAGSTGRQACAGRPALAPGCPGC